MMRVRLGMAGDCGVLVGAGWLVVCEGSFDEFAYEIGYSLLLEISLVTCAQAFPFVVCLWRSNQRIDVIVCYIRFKSIFWVIL